MGINKKGNADLVTWVVLIVSLLFLAPMMLMVVNKTLGGFSEVLEPINNESAQRVDYVHNTFVSFWDYLIAIAFLIATLMLFIFAFMVDSHPIFSLFYGITALLMLAFSHYVMIPIQTIMGMDKFGVEVTQLPIVDFLVTRFDLILLGVIIVAGIIMYGKFKSTEGFQR